MNTICIQSMLATVTVYFGSCLCFPSFPKSNYSGFSLLTPSNPSSKLNFCLTRPEHLSTATEQLQLGRRIQRTRSASAPGSLPDLTLRTSGEHQVSKCQRRAWNVQCPAGPEGRGAWSRCGFQPRAYGDLVKGAKGRNRVPLFTSLCDLRSLCFLVTWGKHVVRAHGSKQRVVRERVNWLKQLLRKWRVKTQVNTAGMLPLCDPWPEHRPQSREGQETVNLSLKELHHKWHIHFFLPPLFSEWEWWYQQICTPPCHWGNCLGLRHDDSLEGSSPVSTLWPWCLVFWIDNSSPCSSFPKSLSFYTPPQIWLDLPTPDTLTERSLARNRETEAAVLPWVCLGDGDYISCSSMFSRLL